MDELLGLISDEDKSFLVHALNAASTGGPVASRETLRFFTKDAVKNALDTAAPKLNDYGQMLTRNIRAEL